MTLSLAVRTRISSTFLEELKLRQLRKLALEEVLLLLSQQLNQLQRLPLHHPLVVFSGMSKPIGGGSSAASAGEIKKLNSQIEELKLQTDTLDKERDFYFSKLRDIELLL